MCPSEDAQPLRPSVQIDPNSALGRALLASPLDGALDGNLRSYRGRRLLILVVLSFYWFVPTDIFVDIWAAADLSLGACRCVGEGWSVAVNASAADPCAACAAGGGRVDCPLDADLTTMAGEFELYCESTWMLSDGVLQLTLAKDIRRAANVSGGPGSEWWHGLLEGEDTLDHSKVSVGDYVSIDQVPAEQREGVLQASRADHERQVERAAAAAAEAALPASQREGLEKLRAQFPDIPIEYGDTSKFDAAHGL